MKTKEEIKTNTAIRTLWCLIARLPKPLGVNVLVELKADQSFLEAVKHMSYPELRKTIVGIRRLVKLAEENPEYVNTPLLGEGALTYHDTAVSIKPYVPINTQWRELEALALSLLLDNESLGCFPAVGPFQALQDVLEGQSVLDVSVTVLRESLKIRLRVYVGH